MTTDPKAQTPRRLLELATCYQRSQVLFAFIELELPSRIGDRAVTTDELASELGLHPRAADRFVRACLALGLLERDGPRVRSAPDVRRFLAGDGTPDLRDALLAQGAAPSGEWSGLADRLRSWQPPERPTARAVEPTEEIASLRATHGLSCLVGAALASSFDFRVHRRLLDLGCGSGGMAIAICQQHPHLEAMAFERTGVAELAEQSIAGASLSDRITVVRGDFFVDPLPTGADVVLLANVLSVASEAAGRDLLRRIAATLLPGGVLLVTGWVVADNGDEAVLPLLFCLGDIVQGAPDVERSVATYSEWLRAAGFSRVRHTTFYPPWSALVAHR